MRRHARRVQTIWSDSVKTEVPERFRGLFTVALPIKYLVFILFAAAAIMFKVPSITETTSLTYNDLWAFMLGITSTITLLALIFRLERLELYATVCNIVGIATYPVTILFLVVQGEANRLPAAIGLLGFLLLPVWRVTDIIRVIRRRKEAE